jgi:hypothetical protein
LLYKASAFGRPLSSKVIGHANIKITERNATLTREHFQVIQIKMPTRKQLFHPSQIAHPQSSIPKELSIQPHLEICARAPASSQRRSIHENSHTHADRSGTLRLVRRTAIYPIGGVRQSQHGFRNATKGY